MKRLSTLIVIVLFLSACSSVPLHIPAVENREYEVLGEAEGTATGIMLFQFIPIGQNDRFQNAYRTAVESRGGDALLDPVIEERWFWAYILNGYITTVRGTVIRYNR
jgi:hypothetical protein